MSNKNKIIKIPEYKQYSRLRLLSFFIVGLVGVTTIAGVLFVYSNIYEAIDQTQNLISQNSGLTIDVIDFPRYEKVDKAWQEKYSVENKSIILNRDPFSKAITTAETILEETPQVIEVINVEADEILTTEEEIIPEDNTTTQPEISEGDNTKIIPIL